MDSWGAKTGIHSLKVAQVKALSGMYPIVIAMKGLCFLLAKVPAKRPVIAFPGNIRDPVRGPKLPRSPNLMNGTTETRKPTAVAHVGPSEKAAMAVAT
ncbi:MAG: hypothetical protein BA066_00070 [Candidatus Korarchaeota archaeon NZ13-K]|nr:MAG: hypothetical protein BA066_00070 [Candidatus Korarchaeota archaeon NZ13-K]